MSLMNFLRTATAAGRSSKYFPNVFTIFSTPEREYCLHRLKRTHLYITRRNVVEDHFKPFGNHKIATKFRQLDGIPNTYELVYRINFANYLIAIQLMNFFAIGTFVIIGISQLIGYEPEENTNPASAEQVGRIEMQTTEKLPTPAPNEMFADGWESFAVMLFGLLSLTVALVRLQRRIPIRLYTSPSGHSFAVYYGHIIPSKTTKREFLAGTLKSMGSSTASLWSDVVYQDGTGHQMLLFENYFRYPADLDYLLGIKPQNLHKYDDQVDR